MPGIKTFRIKTPLGNCSVSTTSLGVCGIRFLSEQEGLLSPEKVGPQTDFQHHIAQQFSQYFSGHRSAFEDISLDLVSGTDFQRSVWQILQTIPYGETRSYAWISERLQKPNASRPVGNANAKNPCPIIIPCHRVIKSDGTLGGYMGRSIQGQAIKQFLLNLEK